MSSVGEVLKDDLIVFAVHFKAMLKKNWLVSKRSYKTTIGQLLAPILFLILLFGLNKLPSNNELNPPVVPMMSSLPQCDASLSDKRTCISLLYSWNGTMDSFFAQSDADTIMDLVSNSFTFPISDYDNSSSSWDSSNIYRFDSRDSMDTFIIDNPNVTQAAIVFSPSEMAGASVGPQYTILYNDTTAVVDYALLERIQAAVDQAILTYMGRASGKLSSTQSATITVSTRKFPVTNQDSFDAVASFGSLFFYCALMFNFSIFLYQIVNEKQLNLRLGMRMVGLSDIAYWLSWEITNWILMFVYSLIIIFMGYILGLAFFLRTHFLVLLFSFFLFGIAMTQLALLLGMFISTTRQAINVSMLIFVVGVVAQIIFSIQYVFLLLYDPSQASPAYRIILQFYPPFNLSKIISDIGTKSNTDAASQLTDNSLLFNWSDLYKARDYGSYSVPGAYESMGFLIMDICIFTVLSWYFYNTGSSEKGSHPLFFLTREYWRSFLPKKQYDMPTVTPDSTADSDVQNETITARDDTSAELRVLGLHKKYSKLFGCKSTIYAVRGVSLSIRQGQVFTLLGHNGAGKTTTLSMLTGIIKPSQGDALLYGKSLKHELPEIQGMLGVCPQHDILWAELTAKEHLEIFSEIKRIPKETREQEIEARLRDVLLYDVRNKQAGKYSGGMKRRLSVAISAIGDPKIIFLDEPTTGLDPGSRREIWNAIQKLKKDRIIILTTHSMEEADFLGDRIGIMARGKLKCVGTSLHLKNKFGLGYRLTVTTIPEKQEEFKQHFKNLIPRAELVAETIGGNLIYGVQTSDLNQLVPFFQIVEGDNELGVKDWGISQTTLEEVFLKVTHESEGTEVTIISQ